MDSEVLKGKSALVTGASQGIGLACAAALAQDGATVVIMGRDRERLEKAQAQLRVKFPATRIEMSAGDGMREEDVKSALTFTHGLADRLDIVVSTVGGPVFQPLLMRDVDSVRQEMDRNFTTGFMITRHGVPLMKRDGAIVCISTAAVTQPTWGLSIYAAGKAALERFVRAAAYELAGAGIRINSVRPGATLSEERAAHPEFGPMSKAYIAKTPMGRLGHPDDIARVVRFLAGPESGWVTGQTFSVDGGLDQRNGPDFMDAFFGKDVMDQIRAGKPVDRKGGE